MTLLKMADNMFNMKTDPKLAVLDVCWKCLMLNSRVRVATFVSFGDGCLLIFVFI